jgi:hypothetical protein
MYGVSLHALDWSVFSKVDFLSDVSSQRDHHLCLRHLLSIQTRSLVAEPRGSVRISVSGNFRNASDPNTSGDEVKHSPPLGQKNLDDLCMSSTIYKREKPCGIGNPGFKHRGYELKHELQICFKL